MEQTCVDCGGSMEEAMLAVRPPSTRCQRCARAAFDVHFRNAIEVLHSRQPVEGRRTG
jgi:hypothetical protein